MAFKALRKRLERGDISDPHTYIELYAEAYDDTGEEDDAVKIADNLYNDVGPDSAPPTVEDIDQRQVADVLALRDYMDKSATENYDPDQQRAEDGRWTASGAAERAVGAVAGAVVGGAKLYAENMGILIHDHPVVKDISWAASDTASDIPRIAQGIFNRMTLGVGPLAIGAVKIGLRVAPVAFHLFVGAVTGLAKAGMWTAKKVTGNVDHAADAMAKLDELAELLKNDPEERADFERAIQVIVRDHPELLHGLTDDDTPSFNDAFGVDNTQADRDDKGRFSKEKKKKKDDEEPATAPEADSLAFGATGGGESFAGESGSVGE